MTPQADPLPQLIPNRVEAAVRRIRERVWRDAEELVVSGVEASLAHRTLREAKALPRVRVRVGEAWGRLYDQRWFHVPFPKSDKVRGPRYLEWRDQGEATLWIKCAPYYGFDVAHRRVALPDDVREAWVEGYCCQSAIWHPDATGLSPQGSVFGGALLCRRDEVAWETLQDLSSLYDLMMHLRAQQTPTPPRELLRVGLQPTLEQATPVYRRLLRLLSDAIDELDSGDLDRFKAGLKLALAEMKDAAPRIRAVLTGHAHIDLVWLWPERMGEAKAVHTFSTVNRLMDLYPEFRFAYSQPASYRAVERRSKELATAVAKRIRARRWQATGAMDVESDTQLPCGEALARSFLLGQEEFKRLQGAPARLLWLPDVFGYTGCLPQLMRLAGVEWFFTTKLTWNAVTRFPYSSFVWRGNDGSEVVAHVTQNAGYNNRLDLGEIDGNARGHAQADVHPEFLHPTGYGDGGGGPTEEMCERARRLSALAGNPELAWDHPEAFFSRLAERRRALPVFQGEFYLEYHRGTYTTHGEVKAAFRALERALQVREAVAVATGELPDLTAVWRRLVFAQFHDYIPGSSVADVYEEGLPELRGHAVEQLREAQGALERKRGAWCAFNPLPQLWRGWARHPKTQARTWMVVPPLSSAELAGEIAEPPRATVHGRVLENGQVRAEIDENGWLSGLSIDGRALAFSGPAAVAALYPDFPANYDAWDIDRHSLRLGETVRSAGVITAKNDDPAAAELSVERSLGGSSRMIVTYRLESGAAVLRIDVDVDWREPQSLLKLHFPTAYRGSFARYGAPFGSVLRSQQPGPVSTEAQWEVPGSRWAAVALDGEREGLALITEAKYGFSCRDGELTVSLLRGARITGCDDHRYAAPPGLNRHRPESPFSDGGKHRIRLAVGSYDACGPTEQHPAALADTLFTEPVVYRGDPVNAGLVAVEGAPTLIPHWAMPAGKQRWVLRLHEVSGQRGVAKLKLGSGWNAHRCGLDGLVEKGAGEVEEISYGPYQIVSVMLVRK